MNKRIENLRAIMAQANVDGFLISSTSNIFYLSGFNRFLVDHDGFLLVTKNSVHLITSPLYTEAVKKFTPELSLLETNHDAWYFQLVKQIVTKENLKVIGFEESDLKVAEYFDLQEEKIQLQSVSLRHLRIQKNNKEIDAIAKASELTDEAFEHILSFVKEGVTELDLAKEMHTFVKRNGAEIGFPSIIAFGRHSAVPHHMTSDEKLQKNSFVLFDFGIKYNGYLSDMSRTIFFGSPTDEQKEIYETTKFSQQKAIDYIQKNLGNDIFTKDVDAVSRKVIEDVGFPSYPHSLGHGVGLEVHEAPTLSVYSPEKLLEAMVFTLEPGIYLPEVGGVRIEDVFTIKNGKLIQLTQSPKELIVI